MQSIRKFAIVISVFVSSASIGGNSLNNEIFKFTSSGAGKAGVKILHVSKEGSTYTIKELEVTTQLSLDNNHDEYKIGDNSKLIHTGSQKNTVYILAKKFGISSPEEFGLLLAEHFISKYSWVI